MPPPLGEALVQFAFITDNVKHINKRRYHMRSWEPKGGEGEGIQKPHKPLTGPHHRLTELPGAPPPLCAPQKGTATGVLEHTPLHLPGGIA